MREYLYLGVAIAAEVTGTTALKFSEGFTNAVPSLVVVVGYVGSFYLLSLTLQELPIGLVYATWSAIGIVAAALLGMALVVGGVVVLNVFSDAYNPAH